MSLLSNFTLKILFLALLYSKTNSLLINLIKGQEFCIHKDLKASDVLKVSYVVSGEYENAVTAKLHGPYSATMFESSGKNNGHFENELQFDGKL